MVRIKRAKVSASNSCLTSILRPPVNATSKEQAPAPLPLRCSPAIFTSTNRLPLLCRSTSIRRLLSPRCNVPSAKLCLSQNSLRPSPLVSNSVTSRLISWRLRRFRTLTPSLSVIPTVHQKRARSTRWVRLTDTTQHWLRTSYACEYVTGNQTEKMNERLLEIGRPLNGMIESPSAFVIRDDRVREDPSIDEFF